MDKFEKLERNTGKKLYKYQHDAIDKILEKLEDNDHKVNLLYQLPTGGGKTVIFSEFARRYINDTKKKVVILTHRIELCGQTSRMLDEFGVPNKIIDSKIKELDDQDDFLCFVAMVETLNNRLIDQKIKLNEVGLVIIDEAHYNSFRKLFKYFEGSVVLGVTATPLSSNIKLPMRDNYDELIVGESISSLIKQNFLAKAKTYTYNVNLNSLRIGANGDYTVASSERLYSNFLMQEKLLQAYMEKSRGLKTLIFNNGIQTSLHVESTFLNAGINVRHLDNTNTEKERREILDWFKNTDDAVLTSVGILTTGFDEPTVRSIILNRATRSLTLYHQMIGRGSRRLPNKDHFIVIDLGNNVMRFGLWETYMDWADIFKAPISFLNGLQSDDEIQKNFKYQMPDELRNRFSKSTNIDFDIKEEYKRSFAAREKSKMVIERSIQQHIQICIENSEDIVDALELAEALKEEIEFRVKTFSYCITTTSDNYRQWLTEDYTRKLLHGIRQSQQKKDLAKA
ncbi:MAG: DEAD/DEAH box helicase family protein [Flavobacteriales bacterium]|nr:DEAD/DEAH box helicase family protein [Flavobacteriales bacterium]